MALELGAASRAEVAPRERDQVEIGPDKPQSGRLVSVALGGQDFFTRKLSKTWPREEGAQLDGAGKIKLSPER